jgi:DNA-binding FadR family transcriptional regulator
MASISDILRCFEFRVGLEGEAAFVAATRQDVARTEDIAKALEALETIVRQGSVGAIADYDFHLAVANASCNPFYVSVMESLRQNINFGMNLARNLSLRKPVSRVRQVQEEHAQVYDAIKKGDAEGARKTMRQHIENARTRIFEGENI